MEKDYGAFIKEFLKLGGGEPGAGGSGREKRNRVQRSCFLDWDTDKAQRGMDLEEGKKLTESVNELLRDGLSKYLYG